MSLLLQQIFSIPCYHCKKHLIATSIGLCEDCSLDVPIAPRRYTGSSLLSESWALAPYHGVMGTLIRRCKYRPDRTLLRHLADRSADAAMDLPFFEAIVHVPVPWTRRMHRGFDQGELLAKSIAHRLQVPHLSVLGRIDKKEQAGLTMDARRRKITERFYCKPATNIPSIVLLVDDVVTTGNTMESCAVELYEYGARKIIGFSLASALL